MKRQAGFAMAGLVVWVTMLTMVTAYYGKLYLDQSVSQARDNSARLVGTRLSLVGDAAKTYSTQFFGPIQLNQTVTHNGYTVPAARVQAPTLADLAGLGFLRAEAVNPIQYGNQTVDFTVQFTVDTSTGCTVPNCHVNFLVSTTAPLLDEGNGNKIDVRRIQLAANTASPGNAGAALPATVGGNPAIFVAKDGNAVGINAVGTAGLVALRDGYDSQGFSAFLRRDGTLPMTGDLNMGGHNLNHGLAATFTGDITTTGGAVTAAGLVKGASVKATTGGISADAGDIVASTGNLKGQAIVPKLLVAEGSSCAGYEAGALATKNDGSGTPLSCQSGVWKAPSASIDGTYINLGSYSGTYNGYNSSENAIHVLAKGGNGNGGICGNRFDLNGNVAGFGSVAYSTTANPDWSKVTTITFMVPSHTSYSITSYPYSCGAGSFSVVAFAFGRS